MSIQRWYIQNPPGQPTEFVSYADHVAALAAARADERDAVMARLTDGKRWSTGEALFLSSGDIDHLTRLIRAEEQAKARQQARQRVEALLHLDPCDCDWCRNLTVAAAAAAGGDA